MKRNRIRALVLAEVKKDKIEKKFPFIEFDYLGYSVDFNVLDHKILEEQINKYEILISEFDTIDKKIIDKAINLKLIICCRGGVQTVVDIDYANSKGIKVCNTPGRNSTAVAEYVLGQIISYDRYLFSVNKLIHDQELQKGHYIKPREYKDSLWGMDMNSPYHRFRGRGLQNITLGVIGYGKVGRVVVDKASQMGMHVLVYDHSIQEFIPELNMVSFEEVIRDSDIITLHCTNRTHTALFTQDVFDMMKNRSCLINTARGDLVDERALVYSLRTGKLACAVIDVTKEEPLPINSPLIDAPNIVITPHIAGATDAVIDNVTKMVIAHISQYVKETNY